MSDEAVEKFTVIRKRATSLIMAAAAIFMLLSLLTFSTMDSTANYWPASSTYHNVCGQIGAALADWLLFHFGYAAYAAVVLAIGFAIRSLAKRDLLDAWMSIGGAILMLAATAAAAQLIAPGTARVPGGGGVVGLAVSQVLVKYFGTTGSWLLTVLFFAIGGLLTSADELALWTLKRINEGLKHWQAIQPKKPAAAAAVTKTPPAPAIKTHITPVALPASLKPQPPPPPVKISTAPAKPAAAAATTAAAPAVKDAKAEPAAAKPAAKDGKLPEDRLPPPIQSKPRVAAIDKIAVVPSKVVGGDYQLPPISLLDPPAGFDAKSLETAIRENSTVLERTLAEFGIGAQVVGIERGPSVTRYELALAPGIKVNRVTGLSDDIAMAVKAPSVRVVAPIPGKGTVGIEVPNSIKEMVQMIELATCEEFHTKREKLLLPILLGKDASGTPILSDLTRMPHLLIAGATGSGKSVCLSSIITTILMLHKPEDVRLLLVDPKMVDLGMFERIPHLLTPVVTDMKRAPYVLEWACKQMDERYDLLAKVGVRHITQYNKLGEQGLRDRLGDEWDEDDTPVHMPYIVVVVDELADMMMVASKEVELFITRLAQKSRAVGIHIILATQRPSVDVITGLIKSNLPTRISFQTTSKVDSRTILDRNGAEKLLGSGDLLFIPPGTSDLVRVQGTYCSDREIKSICDFVKKQGEPAYLMNIKQITRSADAKAPGDDPDGEDLGPDPMYDAACRVVLESRRGSLSLLQRKLTIGYGRAARLVDMMAEEGIVGGYKGSKAREVVMTLEEWEEKHGIPPEERTSNKPQAEREAEYASAEDLDDGDDIDTPDA